MSKVLEDLKEVKKLASAYAGDKYAQALTETIKKELQVLEIIKNKMVNVYQIWVYDDYEKYKHYYPFGEYHAIEAMLTLEEFELIKGVLGK